MNNGLKFFIISVPIIAIYLFLTKSISSTPWIWYETRLFGLLAYITLALTIIIGELRVIQINKSQLTIFKYHIPVSIFAMMLMLIHFIAAIFDKYKWGIGLKITDFLGFSFGDKWLALLSIGTLAFYFLIIVSFTSMKRSIRFLGFKKWKIIHYLSYMAFILAFIHSINLGTDLKTSIISVFFKPFYIAIFWIVISFVIVRMIKAMNIFEDQTEINLTAIAIIVMIVGGVFTVGLLYEADNHQIDSEQQDTLNQEIQYYEQINEDLNQKNNLISEQIDNIRGALP